MPTPHLTFFCRGRNSEKRNMPNLQHTGAVEKRRMPKSATYLRDAVSFLCHVLPWTEAWWQVDVLGKGKCHSRCAWQDTLCLIGVVWHDASCMRASCFVMPSTTRTTRTDAYTFSLVTTCQCTFMRSPPPPCLALPPAKATSPTPLLPAQQ